jgi:hypothetical protein
MSTVPTYLCEKRRGMPVTEVLTHLAHATDDVEVVAARRTAESVKRIDAPSRWSDFQNLATTRREVLVEMAIAYDSANARAIEVASAAQPKTELAVVEALGTDREYRDLEAAAKQLRLDVRDLESKMRKAVPDHHIPSDVIKQELLQTNVEGMLQLGAMYETASRPKEILIDESDSSATQNGGPATAASGNPAYPALSPVQGSGAPLC